MGRAPCCDKVGLKKGPWTAEEDQKLTAYINENGHGSWRALPKEAGLLRCGKSCRLRWTNYLRPDIKRGEFTATEEQTIIQLHALLGNRWSSIAAHLPKRTDNEIKNYWNTHLKKRLIKMGLDPTTHKPRPDSNPGDPLHGSSSSAECNSEGTNTNSSATSHMAQWESVRLEAEARLAREAELRAKGLWPISSSSSSPNPNPGTPASLPQAGILSNQSAMASPQSAVSWPIIAKPEEEPKLGLPAAWDPAAQILSGPGSSLCGAKPNVNALDLMNAIHNWEKSLQGQAGLLWPDSWRSSTAPRMFGESSAGAATSGLEVGHESSCCSSPLNYNNQFSGSPTSTLCSLDHTPKKLGNLLPPITGVTPSDALDPPMKRLSWSDTIHPHGAFNDLILGQNTGSGSGSGSAGDDTSSFSSCLHTLMDMEADDDVRDAKSEAFEKEFKQDVKACPNLSNLALVTESSSLLGEFELTSTDADISSSHYSSSNADDEDHQIGYGALLTEQDYKYCDWNSMLKEVVDSV